MTERNNAAMLRRLAKDAIASVGGPTKMGALIGITGQAVSLWKRVPIDRVADVARVSRRAKWRLRPDLYDRPRR
jgi:pyruvate kinase